MKTPIYKVTQLFLIFISLYNIIYITSTLLPDQAVSYSWLSNLDQLSVFRIPALFCSYKYYFETISVISGFLIDKEAVFSTFPFILLFTASTMELLLKKQYKLTSIALLYLLIISINGLIQLLITYNKLSSNEVILIFTDVIVPQRTFFSFIIPICYLSIALFLSIKSYRKEINEIKHQESSNIRLISAYFIDSFIGAAAGYWFFIAMYNAFFPQRLELPFFLFHLLIFKFSMFVYLLLFEVIIGETIGKTVVGITTKTKGGQLLSGVRKLKYVVFQLIPFWYLFRSKLDTWSETSTVRNSISNRNTVIWLILSTLLAVFISLYSINKIENRHSYHYNSPINIGSYSLLSEYDAEIKPVTQPRIQFSSG